MNCPSCNTDNVEGARFCAKCGALMPIAETEEKDLLLGQKVGGRYTIKRVLGEGGMGRVYEAEQAIAGTIKRIAVKTLHPHLSKDPQIVARFNRECATVAGLKHQNTIHVEDFGQTDDGTLYIAMEFVEGPSVAKELELHGAMSPDRVEHILQQVCGSLGEAHKQGIIHRDLKPENIVLTNIGDDVDQVKVLDFGIAARKDSTDAAKEQKLTQQGMVLGTPPYMSPEQFMGKELEATSDIYSLGIMAYEMLTGRLPFEANTPWEWATKHMTAQPSPFEAQPLSNDIPIKMKAAIMRALEKDPKKRQASAREFIEDLSLNSRTSRTTNLGDAMAPTSQMAAVDPASIGGGGGTGNHTQIGTPMSFEQHPSSFGTPPFGAPQPAIPQIAPPPTSMGNNQGGGPNKGLLFGLAALGGVIVIVAGISLMSQSKSKDTVALEAPTNTTESGGVVALTSSTASVQLAIEPPPTTATATATAAATAGTTTTATTSTAAATTAPPKSALKGEEACNDAIRRGGNGDVLGGVGSYNNCTGAKKDAAKRSIASAVPNAVRNAVYAGDCKKARSIAAAGSSVGASVNVDSQYPQCKGK